MKVRKDGIVETQPISAASLPLPTGASTEATLSSVDGKLVSGGGAEASALRVTIANDSTGVISIDDNAGSLTVDGTVAVTQGTSSNLLAQVEGTIAEGASVSSNPIAVGGEDPTGNLQPIQTAPDGDLIVHHHSAATVLGDAVSNTMRIPVNETDSGFMAFGTVNYYYNGTTWDRIRGDATDGMLVNLGSNNDVTVTSGTISLPSGASTAALQTSSEAILTTIDADTSALALVDFATEATLSAQSAKLPASLGSKLSAASFSTVLASDHADISIDDGGNSITVDGTIAATQSGTWNINNISGTISLPTGAATSALQTTGNAILTTIDADTSTLAAVDFATQTTLAAINAKLVSGTDIGDVTINNGAGISAVNIQDGGNTITVDGTIAATQSGTWNINNVSGTVSLPTGAATETTLASILADTASMDTNLGTVAGAVSGSEMQVDIVAALPTGSNTIGAVTQASGPWEVDGDIAHDAADSGNPLKIGGKALTIGGDVAVTDGPTQVGANDRVNALYDRQGYQHVMNLAYISDPISLTAIDTTYNNLTTAANSADINGQGFRRFSLSLELSSSGTPTLIQFKLQKKDATGNYCDVLDGPWGFYAYEDTYVSSAKTLTLRGEVPGATFRIRVEATGTDISNTFTIDDSEIELIS